MENMDFYSPKTIIHENLMERLVTNLHRFCAPNPQEVWISTFDSAVDFISINLSFLSSLMQIYNFRRFVNSMEDVFFENIEKVKIDIYISVNLSCYQTVPKCASLREISSHTFMNLLWIIPRRQIENLFSSNSPTPN